MHMKFIAVALLALSTQLLSAKKPNIVLIMADDVSPEMFGCYGSKDAKTPNLDRMAEQGVKFNTAWGSAICGPARAQIMTGCYATKTGFWYNAFALPQKQKPKKKKKKKETKKESKKNQKKKE